MSRLGLIEMLFILLLLMVNKYVPQFYLASYTLDTLFDRSLFLPQTLNICINITEKVTNIFSLNLVFGAT